MMSRELNNCNSSDSIPKLKNAHKHSSHSEKSAEFKINSNKLIEQRPRSIGFKSFLNWFKKVENLQQQKEEEEEESDSDSSDSSEKDSSSSSTATVASFAFLPANKYKPYGEAIQPEKFFSPGPYTETYNRLILERNRRRSIDKNISLRKKYSLYSSGTLPTQNHLKNSPIAETKQPDVSSLYDTFSLPSLSKIKANDLEHYKNDRKTASLSSRNIKTGTHVKGKRKAPLPPITPDFIRSYRKKRKAPPPPKTTVGGLEKEAMDKKSEAKTCLSAVAANSSPKKQELLENNIKKSNIQSKEIQPPTLENSPKPWYKRESKQKPKNATNENAKKKNKHEFPEVGFFRCSQLFENIRNMNSDKSESESKSEKRISRFLPNISELDREAAEIIKQHKSSLENEPNTTFWVNNPINNPSSAKELISKFNALANSNEISKAQLAQPIQINNKNEIKLSSELIIGKSPKDPNKTNVEKDNNQNNVSKTSVNDVSKDPSKNVSQGNPTSESSQNKIPKEGEISQSFKAEIFSALPDLKPSSSKIINVEKVTPKSPILLSKLNVNNQKVLDMEDKARLKEMLIEMKNSLPKRPKPIQSSPEKIIKSTVVEETIVQASSSSTENVTNKIETKTVEVVPIMINVTSNELKMPPNKDKNPPENPSLQADLEKPSIDNPIKKNIPPDVPSKTDMLKILPKQQTNNIANANKVNSFAQTNCVLQKIEPTPPTETNNISPADRPKLETPKNENTSNALYMNVDEAKAEQKREEDRIKREADEMLFKSNTNVLLKKLEQAIAEGDDIAAANLAKDLAMLKVNCLVTCSPYVNTQEQNCHRIKIYIEDQFSHQGPLPLQILESTTMGQLKDKVEKELNIPIAAQRWIIGKQLAADDNAPLTQYNNNDFDTPLFLYVIALEKTPILQRQESIDDNKETAPDKITKPQDINSNIDTPSTSKIPESNQKAEKIVLNDLPSSSKKSDDIVAIEYSVNLLHLGSPANSPALKNVTKNTWICNTCTLINSLLSPLCSACGMRKPEALETPKENVTAKKVDSTNHYKELLHLDNTDLVTNIEAFECPICFINCQPKAGVVLRECLHTFCRECLENTIKYAEDAESKCPYRDKDYFCDSIIQEREIRALVDKTVYDKHLAKSVKFAENKMQNTFHCKTPNCAEWCVIDDNVNEFPCPACKKNNCLTCQVIHEGKNCKQYQEQMKYIDASSSKNEGQQTKNMLDEMVKKGEALACPSCQVIMMKKWGCDWVRCSMCKTEICWVTRGPRWGPSGKGDTSAGCQCGVNGIKCHPKCNYCH